jgi:argininosuccinate lyase
MNKLWGARFKKEVNKDFFEFNKSIYYDYKLAKYDIYHSLIHIGALKEKGVLNNQEHRRLYKVLKDILKEVEKGKFKPDFRCEDIHTDIQKRVEKRLPKVSSKLHTFRSRNEQVAFDERCFCVEEVGSILNLLKEVNKSLRYLKKKYKHFPFVGYTHIQRAQIISFSQYLDGFLEMFGSDEKRLRNFFLQIKIYVGTAALGGSPLKSKDYYKSLKEFLKINPLLAKKVKYTNNLENICSRDFLIEFLNILAILQMHLSRLSEDFIIFSTKEFSFLDLPEEFCTGSSLLAQKKNPDFLELVRGYTSLIYGSLVSLLGLFKGLPLTYNKDMQLDKISLFFCVETIKKELEIMVNFIKKVKLCKEKIEEALQDNNLYALPLIEILINKGISFKEAYSQIGRLIRYLEDKNIKLEEVPAYILNKISPSLTKKDIGLVKK